MKLDVRTCARARSAQAHDRLVAFSLKLQRFYIRSWSGCPGYCQ